jgi:hypothetical protein
MKYMACSALPFGFIQVLNQEEAEMPELGKLFWVEASGALRLPLESVSLHGLHPRQAGFGQLGKNRPPVRLIRDPADKPIPLQLVDQSGDGARDKVLGLSQLAQRQLVVRIHEEQGQDLETALGEAIALGPSLHRVVETLRGQSERADGFPRSVLVSADAPDGRPDRGVEQTA